MIHFNWNIYYEYSFRQCYDESYAYTYLLLMFNFDIGSKAVKRSDVWVFPAEAYVEIEESILWNYSSSSHVKFYSNKRPVIELTCMECGIMVCKHFYLSKIQINDDVTEIICLLDFYDIKFIICSLVKGNTMLANISNCATMHFFASIIGHRSNIPTNPLSVL